MDQSILSMRAHYLEKLLKIKGESHFPFTHPEYPHQKWLSQEKLEVTDLQEIVVPENPFEKGLAGGLRLWEIAATPTPWTEFRAMPATRVPAFRKINDVWLNDTIKSFYKVGTVQDGVIVRRPKNNAVVDLMTEEWGWRMLELAHALAHKAELQSKFRPNGYGIYASKTINWVAKLAAAHMYGIPVDVSGAPPPAIVEEAIQSNDGFYRYGISLCDSNNFHAPFVKVPCVGKNAPMPDRDIAFLAVGVYIEPHPKGFTENTSKWLEVNKWSCSPTMIAFAGWELADTILRQQPNVSHSGKPEYTIAAPALLPYTTLNEFIEKAKEARGPAIADNKRYWNVDDLILTSKGAEAYNDIIKTAPPLPCKDCLRINMRADGVPGRPMSNPPSEKIDKTAKYLTREEREWLEWDAKIDQVFDIIDKAVVYYESRLYGATAAKRYRRERRHAAHVRKAMISKINKLTEKVQRAYKRGVPSVAESLKAEISLLQENLQNGIIPTYEN